MSGSGDYISREAAIKRFTFATLDCLGMEPTIRASDVVLALQSIPAADVRPAVRGHNTGNARIFECSECGYGFADIYLTNERDYPIVPNYCPQCGAWMEES